MSESMFNSKKLSKYDAAFNAGFDAGVEDEYSRINEIMMTQWLKYGELASIKDLLQIIKPGNFSE